jgi:hypothetical protein
MGNSRQVGQVSLNRRGTRLVEADASRIAPTAVLRRSEGTCFSTWSDDVVGGLQRRNPWCASLASEAIKIARSARVSGGVHAWQCCWLRASEEGSGLPVRSAPSELGERGNQIGSRAAVLDERGGSRVSGGVHAWQCCWLRVSEEGSGLRARSAPSELGERGNQI